MNPPSIGPMARPLDERATVAINSVIPRLLYCILLVMSPLTTHARPAGQISSALQISRVPRAARALEWLTKNTDWINAEQARITAIPAPPFHESERAGYVQKILSSYALRVSTDPPGNVIGELPPSQTNQIVASPPHPVPIFPAG